MSATYELVLDWALMNCPGLLDDEATFVSLVAFLHLVIANTHDATRKRVLESFENPILN